jgi:DNA-binding HxlR family transcriptional regulator
MGKAIEMSVRLDRVLVDQIAGRWHLLILCALCDHQRKARFNALKRSVPGISQKTLTQCLRQLERSDFSHGGSLPILRSASNIPLRH